MAKRGPKKRLPPVKRKPGRPSSYKAEFLNMTYELAQSGATDFEIAKTLGVHVGTLYSWQHAHPEFREALRLGKETSDERVERSLYHRAVGYSFPAVKILQDKGEPVLVPFTEHVPPDVSAAKMWLTNRRGEAWRDKQDIEAKVESKQENIDVVQLARMILFGLRLAVEEQQDKEN